MKFLAAVLAFNFVLATSALENSAVGVEENSKSLLAADDVCLTQNGVSGCALSALQTSGQSKESFIRRLLATGGSSGGSSRPASKSSAKAVKIDIDSVNIGGSLNVHYNVYSGDAMSVTKEDNAGHGHHDFSVEFDNQNHTSSWSVSGLNTTWDTNHEWNMTSDASVDATGVDGSKVHMSGGAEPSLPDISISKPDVPGLLQQRPYDGCREELKKLRDLKDKGTLGRKEYSDAVLRATEKHCS
jgi:hypothetical protein